MHGTENMAQSVSDCLLQSATNPIMFVAHRYIYLITPSHVDAFSSFQFNGKNEVNKQDEIPCF